jgi:vanillate O-demethylase monooxygenase subunit
VVERLGAVWVKRPGQAARFPTFDVNGYHETARLRHRVEAPLELVLDNFIEVEHTPAVHWLLGYPLERMDEVQVDVQMSEDAIHVYNRGPQKPMPGLLRRVFGLEPSDEFVDAWVTRFSPVHTVYDHYFLEARTGESRPMALREAVFFNPIDAHRTELFTFIYTLQPPWGRFGLDGLLARGLRWIGELEIRRDVETVARLADKRTDIAGNRLGRFDKPLLAARTRIDRIYRGRASEATDEARDRVTDG